MFLLYPILALVLCFPWWYVLGHCHTGRSFHDPCLVFWLREGVSHPRFHSTWLLNVVKSHTLSRKTAPKHNISTSVFDCGDWGWSFYISCIFFYCSSSCCLLTKLLVEDLLPPFQPVWIEQVYNFISDVLWQLLGLAHGGREVRKEIASVCF